MRNIDDIDDLETLALTLWGEGRGEHVLGRAAIACVILNRVSARSWYGNTIKEVCLKGWQFSAWNANDPNRDKMLGVSERNEKYIECKAIAALAIAGALNDVARGSTHYHVAGLTPDWSRGKRPVFMLGNHSFFNNID